MRVEYLIADPKDRNLVSFRLEDAPIILGMVLNNEARYPAAKATLVRCRMQSTGIGFSDTSKVVPNSLLHKWSEKLKDRLRELEPNTKARARILAECSQYLGSVFAPTYWAKYVFKKSDLSRIVLRMEQFSSDLESGQYDFMPANFSLELIKTFAEFTGWMRAWGSLDADFSLGDMADIAPRLSLFARRSRSDEWGENYCTTYMGSFSQLLEAGRHPGMRYEFSFGQRDGIFSPEYYVPECIQGTEDEKEWIKDMSRLEYEDFIPLCRMVRICERGPLEDFIVKATELIYSGIEEEFAQTSATLEKYLEETRYVGSAEMMAISRELSELI
ncbi:hypothetical protein IKW75_00950 [Candidatus Saccharibacteria bacterium]|nr:hypothetical protein [Candidatus Saccharibacteria bacterium]